LKGWREAPAQKLTVGLAPVRRGTQYFPIAREYDMTIRSVGGDKFVVLSKKGKRLSKPLSKKGAKKRLRQVEYFSRHKK